MEKQQSPPIDLIDIAMAWVFGANPSALTAAILSIQYVVRHSTAVREAILAGEQKALPVVLRALPSLPNLLPAPTLPTLPTGYQKQPDQFDVLPHLLDQHHILLVGGSGGGKTTLMHAVARAAAARGDSVLVLDPDARRGRYPEYRVVGGGDDFAGIAKALETVYALFQRRVQEREAGQREFRDAWILLDETQEIIAEIPDAWAVLERIIRRGRKLRIHVVLGSQDSAVRTLGLERKSALLANLARVEVCRDKEGHFVTRLDGNVTHTLPDLPNPDDTLQTVPVQASPDPLLADLLGSVHGSFKAQTEQTDKPVQPVSNQFALVSETGSKPKETGRQTAQEVARQMLERGKKKREIASWLAEQEEVLAHIRAMLAGGASGNAVITWLQEFGVNNKLDARIVLKAAQGERNLLDDYLGNREWEAE